MAQIREYPPGKITYLGTGHYHLWTGGERKKASKHVKVVRGDIFSFIKEIWGRVIFWFWWRSY